MSEFVVVLVTAGSEKEALEIARTVVEERLAACVNVVPAVRSVYRWEGEVVEDAEQLLVLKTRRVLVARLARRIREIHRYEVPEVIAMEIVEGSEPYLEWLLRETG